MLDKHVSIPGPSFGSEPRWASLLVLLKTCKRLCPVTKACAMHTVFLPRLTSHVHSTCEVAGRTCHCWYASLCKAARPCCTVVLYTLSSLHAICFWVTGRVPWGSHCGHAPLCRAARQRCICCGPRLWLGRQCTQQELGNRPDISPETAAA